MYGKIGQYARATRSAMHKATAIQTTINQHLWPPPRGIEDLVTNTQLHPDLLQAPQFDGSAPALSLYNQLYQMYGLFPIVD